MPATQLDSNNFQPNSGVGSPTISNIQVTNSSYTVLDDTAVSTSGGFIKITGTKFNSGVQVYIGTTLATSISLVNSTVLNVQVPATAAGSYDVIVVNTDGTYGIKPIGITFSPINITWVTSSSLGPYQTGVAISLQLSATGAAGYQLQSGSTLPTGLTLSSSGLLSGTVNVVSDTTYTFTIEAYDSELQDAPRTFSLPVNVVIPLSSIELLVVAGGGGGGATGSGDGGAAGGGAGGLLYYGTESPKTPNGNSVSITTGVTYTITLGGGGSPQSTGSNSSFVGGSINIVASGGGRGANSNQAATNGGSGGGGTNNANGTGIVGQGNNGGTSSWSSGNFGGGGGGGAGAVGGNATSSLSGDGGTGLQYIISGTAAFYAGGGGGGGRSDQGAGGNGGGGNGGGTTTAGTTNTGGGGGGAAEGATSRAGGSGIVILRYPDTFSAPASTTGSPTVTVTGGFRIYRFNGSGSITF